MNIIIHKEVINLTGMQLTQTYPIYTVVMYTHKNVLSGMIL